MGEFWESRARDGAARSCRLGSGSGGGGLVQRDLHREGGLQAVGARGRVAHAGEVPDDWLGGRCEGELGEEEAEDDLCGVPWFEVVGDGWLCKVWRL